LRTDNPLAEYTTAEPDDRALVIRARSGDRDSLEALVRRHQPWIFNIVLRMLAQERGRQEPEGLERKPLEAFCQREVMAAAMAHCQAA
jgi:hypothetical protein